MYPNFCSNCSLILPKEISAYNLDNYCGDFYNAGIGFEIECPSCKEKYDIIPENQEEAIELHKKYHPYNESPKKMEHDE